MLSMCVSTEKISLKINYYVMGINKRRQKYMETCIFCAFI